MDEYLVCVCLRTVQEAPFQVWAPGNGSGGGGHVKTEDPCTFQTSGAGGALDAPKLWIKGSS